MRIVTILLACLLTWPASATEPVPPTAPAAPTVTAPQIAIPVPAKSAARPHGSKLTPAEQSVVAQRVPLIKKQLEGLSVDQQRSALRRSAPQRQKLTDAERQGRAAATRANWAAKTPQDRAALRANTLEAWTKLPPEDKTYRRERMAEQLKSLPEGDRSAIISAATAK